MGILKTRATECQKHERVCNTSPQCLRVEPQDHHGVLSQSNSYFGIYFVFFEPYVGILKTRATESRHTREGGITADTTCDRVGLTLRPGGGGEGARKWANLSTCLCACCMYIWVCVNCILGVCTGACVFLCVYLCVYVRIHVVFNSVRELA